ncbi:MAG TPA: hypothetical protein VF514_10850 [Bacteroidota bacterium]
MKPTSVTGTIALAVLLLLSVMRLNGQNLLKNGDFENFTGNEPKYWTTTNIPKVLAVVSPMTKCHKGKYAVKCEVKDFHGSKMPGMISQTDVELKGKSLELRGYYVLNSVGKDAGFIAIELQDADGNTVKICQENLANPAVEFTRFSMAGDIPSQALWLDIKLTLLPGKGSDNLHEGSYILFDDLEVVAVLPEKEKS